VKAICSWCQAEGMPADLGDREPLEDLGETHGLCQRHLSLLLAEARPQSASAIRLLIVVDTGDLSLYEHLTLAMVEVAGVTVLMDRRHSERRGWARWVARDRRQVARRRPRSVLQSMACTFVRLG
jgi:hypothetical protein